MPTVPYPPTNGTEPCRRNPNAWTPAEEDGALATYAKAHCAPCHIKQQCLAYGLASDEVGIYGGKTTVERQRITGRGPRTINGPLARDTVAAVQQLQADGFSISQTARELGIHMNTVSKYRAMVPA